MRWLSYFILAYLTIALQLGLSGYISWAGASPNLVLPIAVFIAINARREEALLGAFLLGALQDLLTQQPLGLYTFSYSMVGLFVVGTQFVVYRDHPLTHFFVTLMAALFTGAVVLFNDWAYARLHEIPNYIAPSLPRALLRALYTAIVAPVMLVGLVRIKKVFGFRGTRHAASRSVETLSLRQ